MTSGFSARQESYDRLVKKVTEGGTLSPTELTAMTRFEKELESRGLVASFATPDEVATYTGYSVRTIYSAIKSGKLIRQSDGSFSRADIDDYLASKGRRPVVAGDEDPQDDEPTPGSSAAREETRYRKARADREELIVGKLRGELLERSEVEHQFTARAHEYKTSLLLLSRRCAHRIAVVAGVDSKVVAGILDEEALLLLKTLSRKLEIRDD